MISILFIIYWVTFIYILIRIGVKEFQFYDFYKVVFPIYIFILLKKFRTVRSILVSAVNVLSVAVWCFYSFSGR
jgi:hypothetical protein